LKEKVDVIWIDDRQTTDVAPWH